MNACVSGMNASQVYYICSDRNCISDRADPDKLNKVIPTDAGRQSMQSLQLLPEGASVSDLQLSESEDDTQGEFTADIHLLRHFRLLTFSDSPLSSLYCFLLSFSIVVVVVKWRDM
jgi:hypothetical protein